MTWSGWWCWSGACCNPLQLPFIITALTPYDYWQRNVRLYFVDRLLSKLNTMFTHTTEGKASHVMMCIPSVIKSCRSVDEDDGCCWRSGGHFHNRERSNNTKVSLKFVLPTFCDYSPSCCQFKVFMRVIIGRSKYTSQRFSLSNPVLSSCVFTATAWGNNWKLPSITSLSWRFAITSPIAEMTRGHVLNIT